MEDNSKSIIEEFWEKDLKIMKIFDELRGVFNVVYYSNMKIKIKVISICVLVII